MTFLIGAIVYSPKYEEQICWYKRVRLLNWIRVKFHSSLSKSVPIQIASGGIRIPSPSRMCIISIRVQLVSGLPQHLPQKCSALLLGKSNLYTVRAFICEFVALFWYILDDHRVPPLQVLISQKRKKKRILFFFFINDPEYCYVLPGRAGVRGALTR